MIVFRADERHISHTIGERPIEAIINDVHAKSGHRIRVDADPIGAIDIGYLQSSAPIVQLAIGNTDPLDVGESSAELAHRKSAVVEALQRILYGI